VFDSGLVWVRVWFGFRFGLVQVQFEFKFGLVQVRFGLRFALDPGLVWILV
jgi:hypothetical protein